ncbi:hypothetical protein HAX54_007624 [Datura stramonium]|uniref:Uncharacterized protein n=1 Tax=Datura stramonium TaxID=4076 RepID=A0ABS8TDH9_DATST|nr:hypothetical protein [Datura stramonium]
MNKGTLLETDSLNVPSEPRQELENSGGTILEAVDLWEHRGITGNYVRYGSLQ